MAWDFSTDPEFQEQLDWVEQFCREEIEPFNLVFPAAPAVRATPRSRRWSRPSSSRSRTGACGRCSSTRSSAAPASASSSWRSSTRSWAATRRPPASSAPPRPTPATWSCSPPTAPTSRRSGGSYPLMNQEIWSAYSMTEPQGGSDPNLFRTTAVQDGDEWVINGEKWFTSAGPLRRHPLRHDHERHVRRAPRRRPASSSCPTAPGPTPTSATTTCGSRSTTCSARGRRQGAGPAAARRRPHPPRHALDRPVQAGLRHDVRAGAQPRVARQDHRRAPDGAGGHRRLLRRDQHAAAARAVDRVDDRQLVHPGGPHPDRGVQVHLRQDAARGVVPGHPHLRLARRHRPHPAPGHVGGRADHERHGRRRRGAQGDRGPQRAEGLPARTRACGRPSTCPHKRAAARKKFEPLLAQDPELEEHADGMAQYMARRG